MRPACNPGVGSMELTPGLQATGNGTSGLLDEVEPEAHAAAVDLMDTRTDAEDVMRVPCPQYGSPVAPDAIKPESLADPAQHPAPSQQMPAGIRPCSASGPAT